MWSIFEIFRDSETFRGIQRQRCIPRHTETRRDILRQRERERDRDRDRDRDIDGDIQIRRSHHR